MSDKPTDLPAWATTGTKTEPSAGAKLVGFIPGAKWAAQHGNWLLFTVYSWILWISNGILTRPSTSDKSPVFASSDQSGNIRTWLDASGYTSGPAICEQYVWGPKGRTTTTTTGTEFSSKDYQQLITGDSTFTVSADSSTRSSAPTLEILAAAAGTPNVGAIVASSAAAPIRDLDNTVVVWESNFEVSTLTRVTHYMGLHDLDGATLVSGLDEASAYSACFVVLGAFSADDALYVQTSNGTTLSLDDSTVNVVVNTRIFLRIEVHGVNTPLGVAEETAVARYFVDGVLVHEEVGGDTPTGTSARLGSCIASMRDTTSTACNLTMGTTRMNYNESLSDYSVPS